MLNLFNRKSRKQLEETIRILERKVDIRDEFIDKIIHERNCLAEQNDELLDSGLDLQMKVLDLESKIEKLEKPKKTRKKGDK